MTRDELDRLSDEELEAEYLDAERAYEADCEEHQHLHPADRPFEPKAYRRFCRVQAVYIDRFCVPR